MSNQCVVAEYQSLSDADIGMQILEKSGFTNDHVSLVTKAGDQAADELRSLKSFQTESPPADGAVATGAMTGTAITTPLAVSTLIGPFMIAGPLAGLVTGAALGGLLSNTDRWGVNGDAATDYEQRVADGSVLVVVSHDDPVILDDAVRSLKTSTHRSIERFRRTD